MVMSGQFRSGTNNSRSDSDVSGYFMDYRNATELNRQLNDSNNVSSDNLLQTYKVTINYQAKIMYNFESCHY